jgi:aldehyde dehydrogenase (NAD+)
MHTSATAEETDDFTAAPLSLQNGPGDGDTASGINEYPLSGYGLTARLHDPITHIPPIDRTPKLYIGGKQARPDSGYSILVPGPDGQAVGEVGDGNRKDIRNAVEAAHAASGWSSTTGYNRAQILYYLAENLSARIDEFARRIVSMSGRPLDEDVKAARQETGQLSARAEVELAIERLFTYAAWADKYDGRVAQTPVRGLTLAVPEPLGVVGILCPDAFPLLGFVSLLAPAIAMGNTVVIVPSETHPLSATDFYQVLETSDVPAGVVNVVTGKRDALAAVLAAHDDVQSVWYFGPAEGAAAVERASAGNLKRTWTMPGAVIDWTDPRDGAGEEFLREATQVKNIWTPHGD